MLCKGPGGAGRCDHQGRMLQYGGKSRTDTWLGQRVRGWVMKGAVGKSRSKGLLKVRGVVFS